MTKFDKFVANFESFVLINEDASGLRQAGWI